MLNESLGNFGYRDSYDGDYLSVRRKRSRHKPDYQFGLARVGESCDGVSGSAMKKFVVVSLALVVVFILVSKSGLYAGLIAKTTEVLSKGFRVLTRGTS